MTAVAPIARPLAAPPLRRRLASLAYEGILLFGIAFAVAMVYGIATRQHHALQGRHGLLAALFVVAGVYFVWCWTRNGQTLPMQTWRLKLVAADGGPVSYGRAVWRYVLAWLWILPGLGLGAMLHRQGMPWALWATMATGIGGYAALTRWLPGQQFLHDVWAGTRLVAADDRRETHAHA